MTRSLLLVAVPAFALTACAGRAHQAPVALADLSFVAAARAAPASTPVQIVEITTPLLLPGQLMPLPARQTEARKARSDSAPPAARVDAANRAALREPSLHGYINAVQIYPWEPGAVYRLFAAPEQVSDIALQSGEALVSVAAGDTVRWIIGDTTSGTGGDKRTHILVKPSAPGLKTNLIITTSVRTYHLQLESTERTAMAAISWTYPADQLLALEYKMAESEAATPIASGVALDHLRFGYVISGDNPSWRPLRAFDDGTQVFIAFPASLATGEAPPLFVVGANGDSQLVNYRVRGNYYIVDRLFVAAELRLGEKPQSVVRITRSDTGTKDSRARRNHGRVM
jgi:type IV secretion system protein TrbG